MVTTALLVRERGARATSIDDVLAHSGAPRGSVYHHFPGGREQLLREATDYAGELRRRAARARAPTPLAAARRCCSTTTASNSSAATSARAARWSPSRSRPARPSPTCTSTPARRSSAGRSSSPSGSWPPGVSAARAGELAVLVIALDRGRARHGPCPPDTGAARHRPPPAARAAAGGARRQEPSMTMTPTTTDWQPTACILCECNCGIEVQLEGRTWRIRGDKAHPGLAGLHLQQGDAPRPLPERPAPADVAAAPPRRTARYEEIDWDTAIAEIAARLPRVRDEHGGESIFYYGGGGQGNHLGGAYSGAFLKALGSRYRSSALAQEKTGEAWVDAQLYGRPHPRRVRARRGLGLRRQEPVDVAELPARARGAARDRQGPRALDDRDRPGGDRHGQDGRLPPARAARQRRLVPGGARRDARAGGPPRPRVHRRARERRRSRCSPRSREVPIGDYAQRCGVDEDADPRRRAAHRAAPTASRCSRTSASSRARTARSART